MTSIKWRTNHGSERQLQLRKSLDALSAPTRHKSNIASIAKVACDGCPFRGSNCTINTSNDNPYGHLAVILTRGSFPKFPDVTANRRNFRANLDNQDINVDEVPCADLLLPPKTVRDKYSPIKDIIEKVPDAPTPKQKTWEVSIDFPVVASFGHKPTDEEINKVFEEYYNRLSQ